MKNIGKIIIFLIILLVLAFILMLFKEQAISLDERLFYAVNGFSNPLLDLFFIFFTYFGSIFFWVFIIIMALLKKERKLSVYLIYNLIISSLISLSLKWIFLRARPDGIIKSFFLDRRFGPSFPSGHAANAFSGAVVLSSFYKKFDIEILFYFLAIVEGFSRIYLGAHYPIDVLFGSLIGIIVGNIVLNLPTKKTEEKMEEVIQKTKEFLQRL